MTPGSAVAGVIVLILAVFFFTPMLVGGSVDACQALAKHNVSKSAASIAGTSSGPVYEVINSVGQMGAATAEAGSEPNMPASIRCTMRFWELL